MIYSHISDGLILLYNLKTCYSFVLNFNIVNYGKIDDLC